MNPLEHQVLLKWMNTEFRHACTHDTKRLEEALLMITVGIEQGDDSSECMSQAIACFVCGLIHGDLPITVPVDNK